MRTTLTLDEDVASRLKEASRKSGKSFKDVVNDSLRAGLDADKSNRPAKPFRVRARKLGLRPGISLDNIGEVLEQFEGPRYR
ncbi:MAG: CopG family transcriptional regulator [Actinomycetota bacterium]